MNLDLIDDETLDAIPEGDPGYAFAQFERACRKTLLEAIGREDNWQVTASLRLDYMHDVIAAAQHYQIPDLCDYKLPSRKSYDDDHFEDFTRRVRFFVTHLRLTAKSQRGIYSVELQGTHKERIRTLVQHLKAAIDGSNELSDKKKALLHKRIREFEAALEGKRLSFAEAMIFVALLGAGLQGAGDCATGVHKIVHEISVLIGQSKEVEDDTIQMLPRPEIKPPIYLIEAQSEPASFDRATMDDEIPF